MSLITSVKKLSRTLSGAKGPAKLLVMCFICISTIVQFDLFTSEREKRDHMYLKIAACISMTTICCLESSYKTNRSDGGFGQKFAVYYIPGHNDQFQYKRSQWTQLITSTFWRYSAPGCECQTRLSPWADQLVARITREMTVSVVREVTLCAQHVSIGRSRQPRTSLYYNIKIITLILQHVGRIQ